MSSYVVTGAARGIGYEFLRQLSSNPNNTVFGLVREKSTTDEKIAAEFPERKNIHVLQADVTDYEALQKAAEYVSTVTNGALDYVIANAAISSSWQALAPMSELAKDPSHLQEDLLDTFKVNVVGVIHVFNTFLPLLLKGKTKKAIAISSGMADMEAVRTYDIDVAAPYSISKAALNLAVTKFSAEYRKEGVLFMSICPGMVQTRMNQDVNVQSKKAEEVMSKWLAYEPSFKGPDTPEDSVKAVLSVIENSTVDGGQAGAFLSHFGTKKWL